jgi:hypothetical protein
VRLHKLFPISLSLSVVGVGFLASAGLTAPQRSLVFHWRNAVTEQGHFSPVMAKVTWPNGDSRTLSFEGVGCEISMCSRVRIQSRPKGSMVVSNTWLDAIASIKDITSQDALFIFKDGTARRLPVVSGNRFLYFASGKMEMGKFKSVEFLAR